MQDVYARGQALWHLYLYHGHYYYKIRTDPVGTATAPPTPSAPSSSDANLSTTRVFSKQEMERIRQRNKHSKQQQEREAARSVRAEAYRSTCSSCDEKNTMKFNERVENELMKQREEDALASLLLAQQLELEEEQIRRDAQLARKLMQEFA